MPQHMESYGYEFWNPLSNLNKFEKGERSQMASHWNEIKNPKIFLELQKFMFLET